MRPTGILFSFSLLCNLLQPVSGFADTTRFNRHHSLGKRAVRCRNQPGGVKFPTTSAWNALNSTVGGRLQTVVPFAQFCKSQKSGSCTAEQYHSGLFRKSVPGAMNQPNWEQDYSVSPPSLCYPETKVCGQGNVPLYVVMAKSASDIQAAVNFARTNDLRLAVKASGHDYLGRSTAKNSLLISTHLLQEIKVTENFVVGKENFGTVVTVGTGVTSNTLYAAAADNRRTFVGGVAATVVGAAGYVQGGGHSVLSPMFGLAADNCVELQVVIASGALVKANAVENPDLFWAMRGGGAGSWGVVVSATFRTFPTFNTARSFILLTAKDAAGYGKLATIHAKHIFDWDGRKGGHYAYLSTTGDANMFVGLTIDIFFPDTSVADAEKALKPFLDDLNREASGSIVNQTTFQQEINNALEIADDPVGYNVAMGSRLIPSSVYNSSPASIGDMYTELLKSGASLIFAAVVGGGKLAENANVNNAIHPKWRTAKTHLMVSNVWANNAAVSEVKAVQSRFKTTQLPIMTKVAGADSGAYSNEADAFETNFQSVFFGSNYARLKSIKQTYDPTGLFIVQGGVGSEGWDAAGMCTV